MKIDKFKIRQVIFLIFCIIMTAISQTLCLKANIGVMACWDSVNMNLYELTGIKVGTLSIMFNCLCVLLQLLLLRKSFSPAKLLQVPLAMLSGVVVNIMYYNIMTFEVTSYAMSLVLLFTAFVGLAIFVGGMTMLNLITMPLEALCYSIDQKYGISFAKLRTGTDVICIALSLSLSFIFGLSLKIREGTIIGLFLVGPLMGFFLKLERKLLGKYLLGSENIYKNENDS